MKGHHNLYNCGVHEDCTLIQIPPNLQSDSIWLRMARGADPRRHGRGLQDDGITKCSLVLLNWQNHCRSLPHLPIPSPAVLSLCQSQFPTTLADGECYSFQYYHHHHHLPMTRRRLRVPKRDQRAPEKNRKNIGSGLYDHAADVSK